MNQYQWITLIVAVVNLALVWMFPPYDYVSAARNNVPTFDGVYFFSSVTGDNLQVNSNFLQLEAFAILLNTAIAWLLLKTRVSTVVIEKKKTDWQRIVLIGVGLNMLLVLPFPPMENFYAVSRAALPSFDGFYFIFGEHGPRTIVTQLLYIEVIFVLINGAICWLLFRRGKDDMSDSVLAAMANELKRARR